MLVDLVQVTTRDGVRLDGMYVAPSQNGESSLPVDAVCCIHGTGGNFYGSTLFDAFAERFLALGCGVLRVNTRGHDGISTAITSRGGKRLGAAYEIVDDCRHDIAAWIDWLKQRAGPRVALMGHSSGAVKSLYALAHEPEIGAKCVIAISPPRLSYSIFCASSHGQQFMENYRRAEELVDKGQPLTLLEVQWPLPMVISAGGYVEKYGPDERYDFLKFIASVSCPALVTFGGKEVEDHMAFTGVPERIEELARKHKQLAVATIPDADHFYTGSRPELITRMETWLKGHI